MVKNLPANAGDTGDSGSIPGSGRYPAGGNGNPLQYSCLGNPMDGGAWQTTVHEVCNDRTGGQMFYSCLWSWHFTQCPVQSTPSAHNWWKKALFEREMKAFIVG